MSTRILAAAALLALPVLADDASSSYSLVLTGGPVGQLAFSDIDSLVPRSILRSNSHGPDDDDKDGHFKKSLRLDGTFSRPWNGETALAGLLGQVFSTATFSQNLPEGAAPRSGTLQRPRLLEWTLNAEQGLSASETIKFEFTARNGGGK